MNTTKILTLFSAFTLMASAQAQEQKVTSYRYAGPIQMQMPVMLDSLDINGKGFGEDDLLNVQTSREALKDASVRTDIALPKSTQGTALHLLGFSVENDRYSGVNIAVKNISKYQLFVDGVRNTSGSALLEPGTHDMVVKYLTTPESTDSLNITVSSDDGAELKVGDGTHSRLYTMEDVLTGWHNSGLSLSPNGKYAIVSYRTTLKGGQQSGKTLVKDVATWQTLEQRSGIKWMPHTNRYYFTRTAADNSQELVVVDPQTKEETVLARHLPNYSFIVSPDEQRLIYTITDYGPKEKKEIYEVVDPDDRQPGWRDRTKLAIYDLRNGILQPLTFGSHNMSLADVSSDGRYALVMKEESRLTQRPTSLRSLYRIDLQSFAVDTLVSKDGFMEGATFSPDGTQVLLTGSPEAFGSIGNVVPAGKIPSMIDTQLYLMDIATKKIQPLTRTFNPNVQRVTWSEADGLIYFNAEDKDCMNLFRLTPKTGKIQRINVPEEMVMRFDVANQTPLLAFCGLGASNSDRLYTLPLRSLKPQLVEDLSKDILRNVELGECRSWNYLNTQGDTICCRYYLPPHFDATKQYPMIVNYYGGCSPTSRNFESRYPHHLYAAQGYVVLIVNPSGATGFGQEFSSRHVNTAGEGVAEDIIGAVKTFCQENSFVNAKKIGCIGASYGGFMTQYLQTKTDIFAAAISHAGISDHTSYWGEGYWGYSYSEVSMANSYPWTDRHLYVDQSPLFNADKIHTPLLFLHGTADTNVPVGESIQMFTALKLLGRPTAMVLVDAQDHHILDYNKRIQWQNTIFAWFAKWLKDDPTWWKAMYNKVEASPSPSERGE